MDDPPHDHLVDPEDAHEFLRTHHLPAPVELPTADQLARLRDLRRLIRALADEPGLSSDAWRTEIDEALARVDFRLGRDDELHSAATGWDAIADELLPAAIALAAERDRMRRCGNPTCRWLFVDRSRRGDRIWCEAAVCGNRVKVGRHRRRAAGAEAET